MTGGDGGSVSTMRVLRLDPSIATADPSLTLASAVVIPTCVLSSLRAGARGSRPLNYKYSAELARPAGQCCSRHSHCMRQAADTDLVQQPIPGSRADALHQALLDLLVQVVRHRGPAVAPGLDGACSRLRRRCNRHASWCCCSSLCRQWFQCRQHRPWCTLSQPIHCGHKLRQRVPQGTEAACKCEHLQGRGPDDQKGVGCNACCTRVQVVHHLHIALLSVCGG